MAEGSFLVVACFFETPITFPSDLARSLNIRIFGPCLRWASAEKAVKLKRSIEYWIPMLSRCPRKARLLRLALCRHCTLTIPLFRGGIRHSNIVRRRVWYECSTLCTYYSLTSIQNVTISASQTENKEQNVSWTEQNPSYNYTMENSTDTTFDAAETSDVDLGDFLSRPIKIQDYDWSPTISNFYQEFDPWSDFLENPRVINRINNYNMIKCNLHVKFVLNGNGFYYGRLLANYKPLPSRDNFMLDRGPSPEDNIAASQRPHVYLDPTTSQGGQLDLPFFFNFNAVSIPSAGWDALGKISIRTINDLKHANGATAPVRISVFAWASDVALSVPTSNDSSALVAQSGMEPKTSKKKKKTSTTFNKSSNDEYGDGIVSKPAGVVARIAGMLHDAPIIGPYARATEIAASGVSNIARMFGYSRPDSVDPIQEYVPRYGSNIATTNMQDTTHKLTFDPKQELTVDSRTAGLGGADEMSIKSIATRESYFTTVDWNITDTPDQPLVCIPVGPSLGVKDSLLTADAYHPTALALVSAPFEHWRGSIKYRFQVVASNYHKGRLKLQWDPYESLGYEFNTQYTEIIDIAENKDFTIEVGWGSFYPWLEVTAIDRNTGGNFTKRALYGTVSREVFNGSVTLSVLNELTSPSLSAGDTVHVNCFVSAGDNFELANPAHQWMSDWSYYEPQSGFEFQAGDEGSSVAVQKDEEHTEEPSKPVQDQVLTVMGNQTECDDPTMHVFFGDPVTSLRQIFKRYCYLGPLSAGVTSGKNHWWYDMYSYPPMPGYLGAGESGPYSDAGLSNENKQIPLTWFKPAFVAWKGGLKWKVYREDGGAGTAADGLTYIKRLGSIDIAGDSTVSYGRNSYPIDYTNLADLYGNGMLTLPTTWPGAAFTPAQVNPVVDAEIPYFSNYRFAFARQAIEKRSTDPEFELSGQYTPGMRIGTTATCPSNGAVLQTFVATGEDFSLFWFIGAPVLYRL